MKYDISKSTAPVMPALGKGTECIKLLLSQTSENMREPLVPMLFPILGAHISGAKYLYPDNNPRLSLNNPPLSRHKVGLFFNEKSCEKNFNRYDRALSFEGDRGFGNRTGGQTLRPRELQTDHVRRRDRQGGYGNLTSTYLVRKHFRRTS